MGPISMFRDRNQGEGSRIELTKRQCDYTTSGGRGHARSSASRRHLRSSQTVLVLSSFVFQARKPPLTWPRVFSRAFEQQKTEAKRKRRQGNIDLPRGFSRKKNSRRHKDCAEPAALIFFSTASLARPRFLQQPPQRPSPSPSHPLRAASDIRPVATSTY